MRFLSAYEVARRQSQRTLVCRFRRSCRRSSFTLPSAARATLLESGTHATERSSALLVSPFRASAASSRADIRLLVSPRERPPLRHTAFQEIPLEIVRLGDIVRGERSAVGDKRISRVTVMIRATDPAGVNRSPWNL